MLGSSVDQINIVYLLSAIFGTAITTFLGIYGTVIYPRKKERKRLDAEHVKTVAAEQERQARRDRFIDGIPAEPGMTEVVLPAAVRLDNLADVVDTLAKRVDETNGTGRRSEGKIDLLLSQKFPDVHVPFELQKH